MGFLGWPLLSSFGTTLHIFHRAELVQTMYDGLPKEARDKVHTGKHVVNTTSNEVSVRVICADCSSFHGSVIIGADGVYSKTRRLMGRVTFPTKPKLEGDDEYHYTSTYRCLSAAFPNPLPQSQGWIPIRTTGTGLSCTSRAERKPGSFYRKSYPVQPSGLQHTRLRILTTSAPCSPTTTSPTTSNCQTSSTERQRECPTWKKALPRSGVTAVLSPSVVPVRSSHPTQALA
jgi:hypothetical protein